MGADRAPLDELTILAMIDGMLGKAAAEDRALARLDLVDAVDLAHAQIFAEVGDYGPWPFTYSPNVRPLFGLRDGSNRWAKCALSLR